MSFRVAQPANNRSRHLPESIAGRVGIGYDIHRLVKGRRLFLGGVRIPHKKGLLGHSDGDVLGHAIADAILGAMAAGDIGGHFPDKDPRYKGIASSELLKKVLHIVTKKNYKINNIDTVIIAQKPDLSPFKKKIQENIAKILNVKKEFVSIKAKTNEGLDAIGNEGAIAAYATVTIIRGGK